MIQSLCRAVLTKGFKNCAKSASILRYYRVTGSQSAFAYRQSFAGERLAPAIIPTRVFEPPGIMINSREPEIVPIGISRLYSKKTLVYLCRARELPTVFLQDSPIV